MRTDAVGWPNQPVAVPPTAPTLTQEVVKMPPRNTGPDAPPTSGNEDEANQTQPRTPTEAEQREAEQLQATQAAEQRGAQAAQAQPQTTRVVSQADALQEQQREAARQSVASGANDGKPLTETVAGGRYVLDDGKTVVDANGKAIEDKPAE